MSASPPPKLWLLCFQNQQQTRYHAVQIFIDFDVRATKDGVPLGFQKFTASHVISNFYCFTMGCAIDFDHKLSFPAKEIRNERANGFLPDKFVSIQSAAAETTP